MDAGGGRGGRDGGGPTILAVRSGGCPTGWCSRSRGHKWIHIGVVGDSRRRRVSTYRLTESTTDAPVINAAARCRGEGRPAKENSTNHPGQAFEDEGAQTQVLRRSLRNQTPHSAITTTSPPTADKLLQWGGENKRLLQSVTTFQVSHPTGSKTGAEGL